VLIPAADCVPCSSSPLLYRPKQCKLSLVGNCAACSLCAVGSYRKARCTGPQDTVCDTVPVVPTPQFVGRLSVVSTPGLSVPLLTNTSVSTSNVVGLSLSTVGATLSAVTRIELNAGMSTILSAPTPSVAAAGLSADIINPVVYADQPNLNVVVRLTDAGGQLIFVSQPGLAVTVSVAVSSSTRNGTSSASCSPDLGGLCLVQVALSPALFPATGSRNVSVFANTSTIASTTVGQVTLVAALMPSSPLWAVFPPSTQTTQDNLEFVVQASSAVPISGFVLNASSSAPVAGLVRSIQFDCSENSASFCLQLPSASPSEASVLVYPRPGFVFDTTVNATAAVLTLLRVRLLIEPEVTLDMESAEVAIDVALSFRLHSPLGALPSNSVQCFGRRPPTMNTGTFFFSPPHLARLYPTLNLVRAELINTAALAATNLDFDVNFLAVVMVGTSAFLSPFQNNSWINCSSSNPAALGLMPDCAGLQLTPMHTVGADLVTASFTLDDVTASLNVAVYVPDLPVRLSAPTSALRPIRGLVDPAHQCGPVYSSVKIDAWTVFRTGGTRPALTLEVASIISTPLISSNPSIVAVNPAVNFATGLSVGTATVGYGPLGHLVVQVKDDETVAISSSSMSLLFASSFALAASGVGSAQGNVTMQVGSTLRIQSPSATLLAAVTVFDGVNSTTYSFPAALIPTFTPQLNGATSPNALVLQFADRTALSSNATFTGVLNGLLASQGCPAAEIVSLPSALSVSGVFEQPLNILVTIGSPRVFRPSPAALAANLATSVIVTDVVAEYATARISVLSNAVLSSDTAFLQALPNGSFVPMGTDTGPATIRATFVTGDGTPVAGTAIVQVLNVDDLEVLTSLLGAPDGTPATTLLNLGGPDNFQAARVEARLVFSNGEFVDVSSKVQFSDSQRYVISDGALSPLTDFVQETVTVSFGGLDSTFTVSASVDTPVITGFTAVTIGSADSDIPAFVETNGTQFTLAGPVGALFNIKATVTFEDGSSAPLTRAMAVTNMVALTLDAAASTAIELDSNRLGLTVLGNTQGYFTLTLASVSASAPPVTVTRSIAANLALETLAADIDLGAESGAPFDALQLAAVATWPVRVSLPNLTGAFSVVLSVDPAVLSFESVQVSTSAPVSAAVRPGRAAATFTVFSLAGVTGILQVRAATCVCVLLVSCAHRRADGQLQCMVALLTHCCSLVA
jgi:hypothetical protein